jgi:hypothetical protein
MRRAGRVLFSVGMLGGVLLWVGATASPAAAQSGIECRAEFNGVNVNNYATPKTALRVTKDQSLTVSGAAPLGVGDRGYAYSVKLELAGVSWTVVSGTESQSLWTGQVDVSKYATRGAGIYKVTAFVVTTSGAECFRRAYVNVDSDGAAVAAVRGTREINEQGVKDAVGDWLEQQAGPPADSADTDYHDIRTEVRAKYDAELTIMKFCLPLALVATAATIRAVASDISHNVVATLGGWLR